MEDEIFDDSAENESEDSTDILFSKYELQKKQKISDISAMQAVICLMLTGVMFGVRIMYPELFEPVFRKFQNLISEQKNVIPNIITLAEEYLWR